MSIEAYKQHHIGTDNTSAIEEAARELKGKISGDHKPQEAFLIVRKFINDLCYDKSSGRPVARKTANSLLESRSAKSSELIVNCIASCGSMATLAASLLRSMGFAVKLIHGSHPSSEHHAWIEILNSVTSEWESYDLTGYGDRDTGKITDQHIALKKAADWYDIQDYLLEEHKKWAAKRPSR